MDYVSLHHHSTFSYMDGYGTPEQHVKRVADLGMEALALTEHGNVSSHVQLEKACKDSGIKPIFGLEAYTAPESMREDKNTRKWHLTMLAMDEVGYRNLMTLVTRSWAEGFYQWPTISGSMLAEHHEGLIVLSGCADSKLACDLLGGKGRDKGSEADALRTIDAFQDLLGDRYYLETQMFPELERSRILNAWYAEQSKRKGIPLVATADCHYPMPDDNEMQVILHAAGRGSGTVEAQEASWEYDIRLTPPASDKLVLKRLKGAGLTPKQAQEAARTTAEIASRCNVVLPKANRLRFPVPEGSSGKELIWDKLREGWAFRIERNARMRKDKQAYIDRLKYEMEIIEAKDFVDYFLMLADLVVWAKDAGIPVGPARGSAAASLACYLLRITEVDPLQFPMMYFERFIALDRHDIPDVDLDFSDSRRDELRQRAIEVYGEDHVGNIGTFTKYKGKNSLDDVARVNNIPDYALKTIKGLMVERSSGDARAEATIQDTIEMFPQVKEVFERYPVLYKALRLEGNYKAMSVHAAGLVISDAPLTDTVAVYERQSGTGSKKVTRQVVSVNKYDAEYVNLMKADFLGLATMGMIQHALDMVGMTLDELYTTTSELDDPKVLRAFREGDVTGIFQFGGGATRIVNSDVKPDNFLELADINALSRPGPLHSGATQDYIDIKHRRKRMETLSEVMKPIIGWTKGQIIYQEQILAIVREVGGFDWTHAQEIRKIISLKHGEAAFNMREGRFLEGAERLHGIEPGEAKRIWSRMATAGTYAFNVAHSVSYSMLAYWTMWFKVHHPLAFYAASLRSYDKDAQYWLLRDALRHKLDVDPPDPNRSGITWNIDGSRIRAGFQQVSGIGAVVAETIVKDRTERGDFDGWGNLQRAKGIGPKTCETIEAAGNSTDPFGIYKIDKVLDDMRGWLKVNGRKYKLPRPTHKANTIPTNVKFLEVVWLGMPTSRDPRDVIEDERGRTGESVEEILARFKDPHLTKRMVVQALDETDEPVFLRWNRWDFPRFEKAIWDLRLDHDLVLIRGIKRRGFGTSLNVKNMWVLSPDEED